MTVKSTVIETYKGIFFDTKDPQPDMVHINDIAHALGNLCRYSGHCSEFYSVAEHSVLTTQLAQHETDDTRLHLLCLLHDAPEAYLVDIPRPVKHQLTGYQTLESRVMWQIYLHFKINPPNEEERIFIKRMDNIALHTEAKELMISGGDNWGVPEQAHETIELPGPWAPRVAAIRWKRMFERLYV